MNKNFKRTLAVLTVAFHALTFPGSVFAEGPVVDIPENTKITVDTLADGSTVRVIGADGNVNAAGRGILEVLNQVVISQGLDVVGIVAILAQMGIHIENTAQINVQGGLILSTLGINEAAFLAGLNEISVARQSDPAMILNEGKINLDANSFLVMLASAIKNVGDIAANGGTVIMAAGDKAILSLGGDGLVNVEVTEPITAEVTDFNGNKVSDVISNSGKITAHGGFVKLTAKGSEDLFDSIINHTGIIEAQSIGEKNGKIVLDGGDEGVVRVNGKLDASGRDVGEKGGKVHVLGNKVGLFEKAKIDVSGYSGGGEVLVGGDYQGKGDVRTADFTYMDQGAEIWADAIVNGDGGKVILWANNTTRAYGSISAKGGAQSGNGGFVETSGKGFLDVTGIRVDANAANGAAGQWLLDPLDVNIVSGGTGTLVAGVFTPVVGTTTIDPTTIRTALNAGTSVEINTGTTGSDAGNITVSDAISKTAGAAVTLTLKASGAISLGASISVTGTRVINLVLQSGGSITQTAGTLAARGTTHITAGAGNDVSLNASGNNFTGAVTIVSANNVTLTDTNAIGLGASTISGNLNLTAGGAITDSGALSVTGTTTLTADNAGVKQNITLNTAANDFIGAVSVSGNNVTLRDANAIDLGTSSVSGNLNVRSNGAITDSGALSVSGTTTLRAEAANNITLDAGNDFNAVAITSGKDVTLNDINAINVGASALSGDLNVTSAGTLTVSGAITTANRTTNGTTGGISLVSSGADVVVNANVTTGNATVADTAGTNNTAVTGDVTVSAATSVTGAGRLITGNAAITGTSRTGTDSATSGDISIAAGTGGLSGGIGLSDSNAVTVGTSSRTGGGAGTDTTTAGDMTLNSMDEINNGTLSTALGVSFGAASGGATNNAGLLAASTSGVSGNMFLASGSQLNIGAVSTTVASVQSVNISTAGGVNLNIGDAAESLSGDAVTLDSGAGTLTVADTSFDVGTGSLTLRGAEIDLTGGNNSIQGTGLLTIESSTAAQDITIGGAADSGAALDILTSDITALRDGFSLITIGRAADGTGVVTQQAATFNDDLTLIGGSIAISGALTSAGNTASFNARTGDINGAGLITAATIDADAVTGIGNTTALNTAAATISADTTNGNIDMDNTLATAVNAASLTTGTGTIAFDQTGGGALTVTNASTGSGDIAISVTGADLTATSVTAGAAGAGDGNIDLTTLTSGNILLGNVTALDDTVNVTSVGAIKESGADAGVDLAAGTLNLNAATDIGEPANPIEFEAASFNPTAGGNIYAAGTEDTVLNMTSTNGSINFSTAGNITLGRAHAGNGQVHLTAGNSILSQGGPDVRVIANDVIKLIAGGVVGTASDAIQTQLNHAGNLFVQAGSQQNGLSANVLGNFTRASVQLLNNPPGLVSFNGLMIGGQSLQGYEAGNASLYYNPNPVSLPAYGQFDGRYTADFPAFFDQNQFSVAPATGINTAGIDVLPIEGLGILPPVVPIPVPAIPPTPVPEAERPPLVVPLPGVAKPPVHQPIREQADQPVYVVPGRGSNAAVPSLLVPPAGLKKSGSEKTKQGDADQVGMPPIVVSVPASAQVPAQEQRTENNSLPFYISPLSQVVRLVQEEIRRGQSPVNQDGTVSAGAGSVPTPTSLSSEAASR